MSSPISNEKLHRLKTLQDKVESLKRNFSLLKLIDEEAFLGLCRASPARESLDLQLSFLERLSEATKSSYQLLPRMAELSEKLDEKIILELSKESANVDLIYQKNVSLNGRLEKLIGKSVLLVEGNAEMVGISMRYAHEKKRAP